MMQVQAGAREWLGSVADMTLQGDIAACRLCAARFATTATAHAPRPVVWFDTGARILVAGQAPGARVHASGQTFMDASGVRLRDWMGLCDAAFYDRNRVAIVPMAFCFPGYNAKGADLPPPAICAQTWRRQVLAALPEVRLTLLVGGAAMRWHLGTGAVAGYVADWRIHAARGLWCLPHPSWRNTGWLRRNAWFEGEVVPALRLAVAGIL
jgi:uracil-DNA glycosylase